MGVPPLTERGLVDCVTQVRNWYPEIEPRSLFALAIEAVRVTSPAKGLRSDQLHYLELLSFALDLQWDHRLMERQMEVSAARRVLDIFPPYDSAELRRAYRTGARLYHPDVLSDATEVERRLATKRFGRIRRAYELLLEELDDAR